MSTARVWQGSEWAAAGDLTNGGLSPALALNGHGRSGAEVLVELVGSALVVVNGGAGIWETALTPSLGGVLVLCGTELASGLGLLLERLLLLGIGETDLDLKVLALRLDGVVVEGLDDLLTSVARFKAANSD